MFKNLFNRAISAISSPITAKLNINDSTTPDLVLNQPLPSAGFLKYTVKDMTTAPKNTAQSRALSNHILIGNCLKLMNAQASAPVKKWAFAPVLQVIPDAGIDMNAYYDRVSLKFFRYNYRGKFVYFADSADIVTHELGHAFLDAMRPDFWSIQALEIWSFHEAFSDVTAMFNIMNYDKAIQKVLDSTSGDLSKSNVISRLAEEVGALLRLLTKDSRYLSNALRDPAIENFKYVNPANLPSSAPNNALAAEEHSFGRVFSNAWYQIFTRIYNLRVSLGDSPLVAFKTSRDVSYSIMIQAVPMSARVPNYYSSIAKSMVAVAKSKDQRYAEIVKSVFVEWNILSANEAQILNSISYRDLVSGLKKEDVVFKNSKVTIVKVSEKKELKTSDLSLLGSLGLKEDLKFEVASDSYYEFDKKGLLVDQITASEEEVRNAAQQCILNISDSIGESKMWKVEENRLVRRFIS